jgi:hypothetical protein
MCWLLVGVVVAVTIAARAQRQEPGVAVLVVLYSKITYK